MKTIADMTENETGTIKSINDYDDHVGRLMILGLVEQAKVRYEGAAISGDPIEIVVHDSRMSISREYARKFDIAE